MAEQRALDVYVATHCENCDYAREMADWLGATYPQVQVSIVDLDATDAEIPEAVFAAPTYVLDGRVWSLGNPSAEKIQAAFGTPQ